MRRTLALGCFALCAFSLQAETRYVSILRVYKEGRTAAAVQELFELESKSPGAAGKEAIARYAVVERRGANVDAGISCLLHTEFAFWLYDRDDLEGGRKQLKIAEILQKDFAYRPKDRDEREGFYQSWLLLVGTFLQSRGQWETAELYLTNGLRAFPDNPDYSVALTALHETWATRAADRPESLSVTQTARAKHLQKAESYARRALESDPTSSESLLRLAAIRSNRGHPDEAISLLRELLARQHLPRRMGALGHLFLGRLHEACGEGDIAAAQYRSAIALDPGSQTPRLALARLLAASGDRASAATILREAQRPDVSDDQMDVWTAYQASQLRPLDELLRILRTRGEG